MAVGATTPTGMTRQDSLDSSGRERELCLVEDLLGDGSVRLVTLTGPPGVGKTWTAHELQRRFAARGDIRVSVARVHQAPGFDEMLRAVAGAIDVPPSWAALPERLCTVITQVPQVLILDGCEGLEGVPHPVAAFLDLCPQLRLVATSLSPLNVAGEHIVGLDPLPVPSAAAGPKELRESPAVQLFCRRAAETDHGFDGDHADVAAIAELCRRVHGLPLGIEILATRVAAETPAALVDYLESGREVTAQPGSADNHRHASIRAALDWSYTLLSADAARLLRRMAVFAAPATLDMITEVASAGPTGGAVQRPSYSQVYDTVSELVDHRLVEPHLGPGEPAFDLVELVRDYASEQLVEEGEQAQVEGAHTRGVIAFALTRSEAVEEADDDVAQAEMARSEADLRGALRRLVGRADVEDGLLLATALAPFVLRRGYDGFVGPALTSLLRRARQGETGDVRLARATMWKAWLTAQFAQPDTAGEVRADLADALRLARRGGDEETLLQALSLVMQTLQVTGDVAAASAAVAEGLPLVEATGDRRRMARFCAWAGIVATQTGRVEDALDLARRGFEGAAQDDVRTQILLTLELAALPRDRAAGLMLRLPPVGELIHKARRLDDPRYIPFLLRGAAWLSLGEGDLRTAAARCADSLRLSYRRAAWRDLPFTILPLTVVAARRRDHVEAARLHGMVRSRTDLIRRVVPPSRFEEYLAAIEVSRRALGESTFESLADRGESEMRIDALSGPLRYADSIVGGDGGRPRVPSQSRRAEPEQLTPREEEVLRELVTGATNKEISRRLGMAPKTVMHHCVAIYRKLEVRGRAEATAWAFRHGLVE